MTGDFYIFTSPVCRTVVAVMHTVNRLKNSPVCRVFLRATPAASNGGAPELSLFVKGKDMLKKLYAFSQHGLSCAEHTHKPLLAGVHICAFPCAYCENVSLGVPRVSFTYFACCSGLHRRQFPKPYRLYFTTYPCIKQLFCNFFCSALRQNLRFLPTCPHSKHNIVCALLTGRYFTFLISLTSVKEKILIFVLLSLEILVFCEITYM